MSLDFRLPRTLAALASPGALTRTYLSGKRAPYVPPLRLALSLGLVLLLVISLRAPESAGTVTRSSSPAEDLGLLARSYATPLVAGTLLTLPALAGLLKLAFRAAGRPYLEHLVFALHFHAFATLSMLAVVLSSFVLEADGAAMNTLFLCALAGIGVYLLLALRRVHEASWLRAGVAWVFLIFAYGVMNLLVVIGAALSLMAGP